MESAKTYKLFTATQSQLINELKALFPTEALRTQLRLVLFRTSEVKDIKGFQYHVFGVSSIVLMGRDEQLLPDLHTVYIPEQHMPKYFYGDYLFITGLVDVPSTLNPGQPVTVFGSLYTTSEDKINPVFKARLLYRQTPHPDSVPSINMTEFE